MILPDLLPAFKTAIDFDPMAKVLAKKQEMLPVDFFDFYHSVSSVYSSKIEGEDAVSISLEKNYYRHRKAYYDNIRKSVWSTIPWTIPKRLIFC